MMVDKGSDGGDSDAREGDGEGDGDGNSQCGFGGEFFSAPPAKERACMATANKGGDGDEGDGDGAGGDGDGDEGDGDGDGDSDGQCKFGGENFFTIFLSARWHFGPSMAFWTPLANRLAL